MSSKFGFVLKTSNTLEKNDFGKIGRIATCRGAHRFLGEIPPLQSVFKKVKYFIQMEFKPFPKIPAEKPMPHSQISLKQWFKNGNSELRLILLKLELEWLEFKVASAFSSLSSFLGNFDCQTFGACSVT